MRPLQIFFALLEKAKYQNKEAFSKNTTDEILQELEKDRIRVFDTIYGDRVINDKRVQKPVKESVYRLAEAQADVKSGYIKQTMHYLIMQIKIGGVRT